jgi:hypothetical protein
MFVNENKGLLELKIIIHKMTNKNLISEWYSIRLANSHCQPRSEKKCKNCNLALCFGYLTYEKIITDELIDRGLFEYAMNTCYSRKQLLYQQFRNDEFTLYYS